MTANSGPDTPALEKNPAYFVPLPDMAGLSEHRIRGRDCVWCGVTLTVETAVDLGERTNEADAGEAQWFPRGCHPCVGENAYRAILDHATSCEQCVDDVSRCETGLALWRAVRSARR